MAKVITNLAYMITADTREFTKGMVLTKNELKATRDIIESTRGPISQFAGELEGLNAVRAKGAIGNMQYVSALNQLIAGHTAGIPVLGRFTSILALGNPLMIAGAVAAGGIAAGIVAITGAAGIAAINIGKQIGKIDDLIASSAKLGISVGTFQELSHAAGLADVNVGEMTKGIESMLSAVSKAAMGASKPLKAFNLLGIDPKELRTLAPEQQLKQITIALDGMANASDRMRVAKEIFGDGDFLRINVDQLDHAAELLGLLNAKLSDVDEAKFGKFDDALLDFNTSLDATWKKITMAVVPALGDMAEAGTDAFIALNNNQAFLGLLDQIAVKLQLIVAVGREIPAVVDSAASSEGMKTIFATQNPKTFLAGQAIGALGSLLGTKELEVALTKGSELDGQVQQLTEARKKKNDELEKEAKLQAEILADQEKLAELEFDYGVREFELATQAMVKMEQVGESLVDSLQTQIDTFGMTSRKADLYKASLMGLDSSYITDAKELDRTLTELEDRKKLEDAIKSDLKSARSPEEVFKEEVEKYRKALDADLINKDQFDLLVDKAGKGILKDKPAGPSPLEKGSAAAETFLAEARARQAGPRDRSERIVALLASIDKRLAEGVTEETVVESF